MPLVADANGLISGKFRIPDNIPSGVKDVVFTGSGGTVGRATFIGRALELVEEREVVTTRVVQRYDPLAQTFSLPAARQIMGVDLLVKAKGSSVIEVQIREVENGVPTQIVLARSRKKPADIVLDQWNHWHLNRPVLIPANVEYAIVVLCNDSVAMVGTSQLGQWDSVAKRYVTAQPYQVGVMLTSSNASTWTAVQDSDLCFRLRNGNYDGTQRQVVIGSFSVTDVTDLMVRANVECPTPACSVTFRLDLPGGLTRWVQAEQPLALASAITGAVTVTAVLKGEANVSPLLYRDVQLLHGKLTGTAIYVSRAIPGGSNVNPKIIIEAYMPGSSSVHASVKGVDKDDTNWLAMNVTESVQMDDGWVELTFERPAAMTETMLHARIGLSGTARYRPKARNLRMLVY